MSAARSTIICNCSQFWVLNQITFSKMNVTIIIIWVGYCRYIDITSIIKYTIKDSDHKDGRNMSKTQLDLMVPIPVRRAVRKLGQDIRDARLRRRIPTAVMAERASISRTTLNKIEKGDPGVSLGNYANVLFVLGMAERLGDLADVKTDTVGLGLEEERLPQRIRKSSRSGQKSKA